MGLALARGASLEAALAEIAQVVEGVPTSRAILRVAEGLKVEMPITEQVFHVLYSGRPAREAVQALLNREQKAETA